ncbi:hypothetical protein M422DRAFT_44383 [Sphaerobolus stellatus SS14]|nr:hypothetical protein M422DRAFT_44383 [Sphaerobolus stellatus SS14]
MLANHLFGLVLLVVSGLYTSIVEATPAPSNATSRSTKLCKTPIVRREWRTLAPFERQNYLKAVQCLLTKAPLTPLSEGGVGSRYDDLVYTHNIQTWNIHFVGHFFAWHRWYVATYEKALRNECGYTGAQPYWDWTLDVPPFGVWEKSPVFDAVNGFGGNGPYIPIPDGIPAEYVVPGRTGGGCVTNGPFKNMTVRIGPQDDISGNPRCLSRDFSPYFAGRYLGWNTTAYTLAATDFGRFARRVEGEPSFEGSSIHGGGHYGVGGFWGIMGDLFNSPGDPVFFLHHANLDRVWWSWQVRNLNKRLTDISGPINYSDFTNTIGGNVTLDFKMTLGVNAKDLTVGDTMDIRGESMCYLYDNVYWY